MENLLRAWREFKRGKSAKLETQQFAFALADNLLTLRQELIAGQYRPDPYQRFLIRDPKLRVIHKASVRDRVLHQALFRCLYPPFNQRFIDDSYSCRDNKGTHRAVSRLEQFCRKASDNNQREVWILKCDIKKYFDSVNQRILFSLISDQVTDHQTLELVRIIIKSFATSIGRGLPLGNVTSQLFANIYLNPFDQFVKHKLKQKFYIRYCDDFVLVSNYRNELLNLIKPMSNFLQDNLDLELHPHKISVRKWRQGIDFLGYITRPYYRILRPKTGKRFFRRIQKEQITEATRQAYLGVLSHCYSHKIRVELKHLTIPASLL